MRTLPRFFLFLLIPCLVYSACTRKSIGTAPSRTIEVSPGLTITTSSRFTTFRIDLRTNHLELFLRDDAGRPFKRFDELASWLSRRNQRLEFAMNAGMYKTDFSPLGLLVEDSRQVSPLNTATGTGNFYLKPNGVFLVSSAGARIVETSEYPAVAHDVRLATQSGPMLVRHGLINDAFDASSTSRLIRNGVGILDDKVVFVISEQPINFYEFAVFFRDELKCQDALYLDGVVSSLYSASLHRNDARAELGPIIGVVR